MSPLAAVASAVEVPLATMRIREVSLGEGVLLTSTVGDAVTVSRHSAMAAAGQVVPFTHADSSDSCNEFLSDLLG